MQPHKKFRIPEEYVFPLNLNGLNGRFLKVPNRRKKREIMLVYGQHASLESYYGFFSDLSQYGTLTMPDLPGFGGMDSLYKIGLEPTIDELADYLASFIKLRYKNRQFTLIGFSSGWEAITRMLQKYPSIAARVDLLISVSGFTHYEDFKLSKNYKWFYRHFSHFMAHHWRSTIFRYLIINSFNLKTFFRYTPNAKHKYKNVSRQEFKDMINFEVELWHCNDVRTYMKTSNGMFTNDLTHQKVNLAVHHVSLGKADQYFDHARVAKHMKKIYKSYTVDKAKMKAHMPSIFSDKSESEGQIPPATRKLLSRAPKKI